MPARPTNHRQQPEEHAEPFNIGDIYFVLFRQKWVILSFFTAGILAAIAVMFLKPAQYESEVKLYVQYVRQAQSSSLEAGHSESFVVSTGGSANDIIHTEMEFLTSFDLANEVVAKIGADKILAAYGGGNDTNRAAGMILKNLLPESVPNSTSIIRITFQHPDQEIARKVLFAIVDAYINKSDEEHKVVAVSEDFLNQEAQQLHSELDVTETELNKLKKEAGVVSTLEETRKGWNDRIIALNNQRDETGAQLAAKSALLPVVNPVATTGPTSNLAQVIPNEVVEKYKATSAALTQMYDRHVQAMMTYSAGSPLLKDIEVGIANFTKQKQDLENQYPGLADISVPVAPAPGRQDSLATLPAESDKDQVKSLRAKLEFLQEELNKIKEAQIILDEKAPRIQELQNQQKIQSAELDSALQRMTLVQVQANQQNSGGIKKIGPPTPAVKKRSKSFKKLMMMTLAGGAFGGLGLAFLIEMVLDRSVKRPDEVEKKLRLPLFISIPDKNYNGYRRPVAALAPGNKLLLEEAHESAMIRSENVNGNGKGPHAKANPADMAPWDRENVLHRFYAGLRDRLIVNFEVRNLNHNPKLVAVTSCRRGAGVTSIAAGLAASLSETGDGNVLLVDMRATQGAAQQFHKGQPVSGLDDEVGDAINGGAFDHEDSGEEQAGEFPRVLSNRFAKMMPKLKAGDYDYIIFDMPPVSQTSMTPRMAGLMDMVLLVIESEKTNRDAVRRATALLSESKAQISTVLNKVRNYVPTRLHQEFLDDEV